jgi:hypothetical protein
MIAIIAFLAGFYMGIIVFSLLVMARRNANNLPLTKLSIIHYLRKADLTLKPRGAPDPSSMV